MKTDLNLINREQFYVNEHILHGETVFLVIPQQMGCQWDSSNKIFRSSLWNADGELISASFPKFVNWSEKPEVFPVPTSLKNCTVVEKIDGSTLIVSRYQGQYIIRTRGTIDATQMEKNGYEIELFRSEILPLIEEFFINEDVSLLFEWTSPVNRVVLSYGDKPLFYLIGLIHHSDYKLTDQKSLDNIAKDYGLIRPETYTFTNITDLISNVEQWVGREGVCLYSKGGQEIHKIKGFDYLRLHRMKSELSSMEKVLDVWVARNYPSYNEFYEYISTVFDFELAEQCKGFMSKISDGWKEVQKILDHMKSFVEPLKKLPRKDAALKIISSYGGENNNRSGFCFQLLDDKEIGGDSIKKLMFQVLKN